MPQELPMNALVRDLESLHLENVKTYIQRGNVLFQASEKVSPALDARMATAIEKRHGFRPHVLILSADQLCPAAPRTVRGSNHP